MKKEEKTGESSTGSGSEDASNKNGTKVQVKPRGFYSEDISKFKDKSPDYYANVPNQLFWFAIKVLFVIMSYSAALTIFGGSHKMAIFLVMVEIVSYQHLIVFVAMFLKKMAPDQFSFGTLHKMDAMDAICFLGSKESHTNYMNVTLQDIECAEAAFVKFT